jgi:hypothetical protein
MPANPAETLLSPDNHSLLMIDHQYLQMLTIRSHDASELINHAVALVESAAMFKVPMLTTTAFQERRVWSPLWPRRLRQSSRSTGPRSIHGKTRVPSTGWRKLDGRKS